MAGRHERDQGQIGWVEYAMLLVLVSIIEIGALTIFGKQFVDFLEWARELMR